MWVGVGLFKCVCVCVCIGKGGVVGRVEVWRLRAGISCQGRSISSRQRCSPPRCTYFGPTQTHSWRSDYFWTYRWPAEDRNGGANQALRSLFSPEYFHLRREVWWLWPLRVRSWEMTTALLSALLCTEGNKWQGGSSKAQPDKELECLSFVQSFDCVCTWIQPSCWVEITGIIINGPYFTCWKVVTVPHWLKLNSCTEGFFQPEQSYAIHPLESFNQC